MRGESAEDGPHSDGFEEIELVIDLGLLLSPAEGDKLARSPWTIQPDLWMVDKLARLAEKFADKVLFISLGLSQKESVVKWFVNKDLCRKFRVTTQRLLFFDESVRLQQRILHLPSCRYVVSGNAEHLKCLAGLKPLRCLHAPSREAEGMIGEGLLKNAFAFPEWESLHALMASSDGVLGAVPSSIAAAEAS